MRNAMDIVWEKPPEEAMEVVRRGPYTEVVQALKAHPGKWARVPREFATVESAKNAAANMRRGIGSFAPKDSFEAVSHDKVVWARFVGDPDGSGKGPGDDNSTDETTDDEDGSGSTDMLANEGHRAEPRKVERTDPELSRKVRAWAKESGYEVADHGRMSRHLFDAYFTHHPHEKRPAHLRVV